MREIKFRAWDSWNEKYLQDENHLLINPFSSEQITVEIGEIYGNTDQYILEQYTGIKDLNGVEIYEGDILQDVDNGNIVGFVEYDDAFGEYDCGDNNLYECTRDCQVVGNIHEQPELLEEIG